MKITRAHALGRWGSIEMINGAKGCGDIQWNKEIAEGAIFAQRLDVLKLLRADPTFPWHSDDICNALSYSGSELLMSSEEYVVKWLEITNWLFVVDKLDIIDMADCLEGGAFTSTLVLQWFHQHGYQFPREYLQGSGEYIKYLLTICPCDDDQPKWSVHERDVHILKWLHDHNYGCWDATSMSCYLYQAGVCAAIEVAKYLRSIGAQWPKDVFDSDQWFCSCTSDLYTKLEHVNFIKWAVSDGLQWGNWNCNDVLYNDPVFFVCIQDIPGCPFRKDVYSCPQTPNSAAKWPKRTLA